MKKVLITGANSYIGTSFEKYIADNFSDAYQIDTLDMMDSSWREKSFGGYDSIFHVAGIAHQKETKENAHLYYEVNCNLAVDVAKKAKLDGVKQFVFLSSMSVYGIETGVINGETIPAPKSNYGRSKLMAEEALEKIATPDMKLCVLRPPMVYGKDCKGNFAKIKKLVEKLPIFPYVKNERSMIYIDNLNSFVKKCIDEDLQGVFLPQNEEYVSTVDLARGIAKALNKKIYLEPITGFCVRVARVFHPTFKKAFGSLVYEKNEPIRYCVVSKEDSIIRSV